MPAKYSLSLNGEKFIHSETTLFGRIEESFDISGDEAKEAMCRAIIYLSEQIEEMKEDVYHKEDK